MIYFTTFIFTLLLSHIARAVPACGDAAPPKDLYDSTYDDVQQPFPIKYKISWDGKYDNKTGHTKTLTCSNLAPKYPEFGKIPGYENIGGGSHIKLVGKNCQECWEFRHGRSMVYVSIVDDHVGKGKGDFVISHKAFERLHGGGGTKLEAEGHKVALSHCKFK